MSTQYRLVIAGLVTPGLFWLATSVAPGQDPPRLPGPPSNPAPAAPTPISVLLMSNGTVVQGEIVDDPGGGVYRLKTAGGSVPYPKTNVRRAGRSVDDLYRYQVAALPPGDFDERMKLIKWCLAHNMTKEAREHLAEVVRLSPDDTEAARMAANLEANDIPGKVDPAIRQTSGDPAGDEPGALPPELVKRGRKKYGNNLPEIFDLPPALAVRRASEFAENVQPVLQQSCASCHNDKYQGEFQLIPIKTQKDYRNPDIARSNLDAALRLVDQNNLPKSDLLAAGLVPHGGPNKGAIFKGSNDPRYQVISTWVKRLQSGKIEPGGKNAADRADHVTPAAFSAVDGGDGFGTDKARRPAGLSADTDRISPIRPSGPQRITNDVNESADFSGGKAADFPLPFGLGGDEPIKPTPAVKAAAANKGAKPQPTARPGQPRTKAPEPVVAEEGPAVAPRTAKQVGTNAVAVDLNDHPNDLPGMNQPLYPTGKLKPPIEPARNPAPIRQAMRWPNRFTKNSDSGVAPSMVMMSGRFASPAFTGLQW